MNATLPSYWHRVGFLVVVAVTAGVICHVSDWNWWGFSAGYTAVAFADLIIGWTLAGMVIAKVTSSSSTAWGTLGKGGAI
jgi:hypothetical protein